MTLHKGRTQDASSPYVTWKKGTKLEGTISQVTNKQSEYGISYEVLLRTPMKIEGEKEPQKRVKFNGTKAGIMLAARAAGLDLIDESVEGYYFEVGDRIILVCTGTTPSGKGNDRFDFDLALDDSNRAQKNGR